MSGPIVRTGATPKFWENWDQIFGDKKGTSRKSAGKEESSPRKSSVTGGTAKSAKKQAKKK